MKGALGDLKALVGWLRAPITVRMKVFRVRMSINTRLYKMIFNVKGSMADCNRIGKENLQVKVVNSKCWKTLLILDACRYDYFAEEVHKYLDGKLFCVWSPAGYTIDWLKAAWFKERYDDVIYFSTNPFVNSFKPVAGFDAPSKFARVIDLWLKEFDERYRTVPPWRTSSAVKRYITIGKIKVRGRMNSIHNYRLVVHYIQPHTPYIGKTFSIAPPKVLNTREGTGRESLVRMTGDYWLVLFLYDMMGRKESVDAVLRKAYRHNLRIALKSLADIIDELPRPIIVTADHGELLGEYGMYSHPVKAPIPELRRVPLFIVR